MLTLRILMGVCLVSSISVVGCKKDEDKKKPTTKPTTTSDAAVQKPPVKPADAAAAQTVDAAASAAAQDGGAAAANAGPPTNLKVLPKSWSRKQVTAYMKGGIKRGLGQKCSYCHDVKDYAADGNKHKAIAREMIQMTFEMNKRYFGGKQRVTCYTCHLGKKEP